MSRTENYLSKYDSNGASSWYIWVPLTLTPIALILLTVFLIFFYFKIIRHRLIPERSPRQRDLEMRTLNRNSSLRVVRGLNEISGPRMPGKNKTLIKPKNNISIQSRDNNGSKFFYEVSV
jgi:hypothetical protein